MEIPFCALERSGILCQQNFSIFDTSAYSSAALFKRGEVKLRPIGNIWNSHLAKLPASIYNWSPGGDPLISPLIRFCRHSTSGNSPTFCPDPLQRLGEETSRFFGINSRSFYFQFFLLRDLQAVTFS